MSKQQHDRINAIQDINEVERIRTILKRKPRDLFLFDFTTQTGMKMNDILRLKVQDLINLNYV